MRGLIEYLSGRSRAVLLLFGVLGVVLIGAVDLLTGHQVSVFIFYLAPVTVVASFGGVAPGLLVALASAAVWLAADLQQGQEYAHRFIPYWNAVVRLAFL